MLNLVRINNVNNVDTIDINTDTMPLHNFEVSVTERTNTNRQQSQAHGLWPTLSFRDGMEIHIEGDIFGSDSSDYFSKRLALIAALFGAASAPPVLTNRKLGDLVVNFQGSVEDWKCPFVVTAFSAPLQGLSPSRTPYLITFVSWNPYFTGVTSGQPYYYA